MVTPSCRPAAAVLITAFTRKRRAKTDKSFCFFFQKEGFSFSVLF
jgi:hypothetical protein